MSETTEIVAQSSAPAFPHEGHYVDWPSILAGAVIASGVAFVFTTFGGAIGMSTISPYEGDGSAMAALLAVGSWIIWTTVSSSMVGGYVAGRMRRRIDRASADEIGIRDGIHGLAVWGLAILLGVFLLGAGANSALQATSDTVATVATTLQTDTDTIATAVTNPAAATGVTEAEAAAALETARKYAVISAFVLVASLLIAGAGAYFAAEMGGRHRDENRVFARFGRWT